MSDDKAAVGVAYDRWALPIEASEEESIRRRLGSRRAALAGEGTTDS